MSNFPYSGVFFIASLEQLQTFAAKLSSLLQAGDVVSLNGPLGIGKTTLVQNLCQAWQVKETVNSPSFGLIHEYSANRFQIVHADLYRLGPENASRLAPDLFAAAEDGQSLLLVEWAEYGEFLNPLINWELTLDWADIDTGIRKIQINSYLPVPPTLMNEVTPS